MTDHERLGVQPGATREELEAAFRARKLELHPDIVNGRRRQQGLPPDPRADAEFAALVAAFKRLAAGTTTDGNVPDWAKDLVGRWGLAMDAARRGDVTSALGELHDLACQVEEHRDRVIARAQHIHATVTSGIDGAKAIGEGLLSIFNHFKGKKS